MSCLRGAFTKTVFTVTAKRAIASGTMANFRRIGLATTIRSCSTTPAFSQLLSIPTNDTIIKSRASLNEILVKECVYETAEYKTLEILDEFLKNKFWKLIEKKGTRDVQLVASVGDENINIRFGVVDPGNMDFYDNDKDMSNYNGENEEENDDMRMDENGSESGLNIPFTVTVTRNDSKKGALVFEMVSATYGDSFKNSLQMVYFNDDVKSSLGNGAENSLTRSNLYPGPSVFEIDEALEEQLNNFLQARGVDDNLGEIIYILHQDKEQREYINWLQSLVAFTSN